MDYPSLCGKNGGENKLFIFLLPAPESSLLEMWADLVSGLEQEMGFRLQGIKAEEETLGLACKSSKSF